MIEQTNEYQYQPLTIDNYAEVSLGDTTNLIITGGSGNFVVERNDKVDISTAQNDKQKITLIGKEIGTTNIFVRDKITNESCSIEVNVILPFLTLNFEVEKENHLNIIPYSLFALVASEDSICSRGIRNRINSHNPCHIAIRQRWHINYLINWMLLKELLPGGMNYF